MLMETFFISFGPVFDEENGDSWNNPSTYIILSSWRGKIATLCILLYLNQLLISEWII